MAHETTLGSRPVAEVPARYDRLLLFALLSLATLLVGGWLTSLGFGEWYDELRKPWYQPPGAVFGPVWTTLFALLAIATWQVARREPESRTPLVSYAIQLVLNVTWSLLFFTLHSPGFALVDIVLLDAVVLVMIASYGRVHRPAGWLLVPYALWLGLATAINVFIVLHN